MVIKVGVGAAVSGLRPRPSDKLARLPDPPREPEAMQQIPLIALILFIIKDFFEGRDDVLVGSEGYLCREARTRSDLFVPDIVFAKGVNADVIVNIQNGYVIEDVGKPPDLVLEVASPSTGRRDYTVKRDGYARLGVGEYWRFDPSGGQYHDAPLAGDLLVDGAYEPIELVYEADGAVWGRSEALGLDLHWVDGSLRFYDYEGGRFLLDHDEMKRQWVEAEGARAEAERRADMEARARAEAEAELARLRRRMGEG